MKFVLIFLLIIITGTLSYGFYIKNNGDTNGEIIIGISVLAVAFIFMPLFIYHRYKNKNMKDFTFEKFKKELEEKSKSGDGLI
ncbi:hypothetical protein [Lutibacter maritimus]|jgi:hypothetical protein|uniref:Uncharacterized protein n=1 Tax=Lutibacter maritimus TaxID=593133 RepID=A0A1I6PH05_9FLAO|nr:hypothetical protein [Lutibacter maritimus]SFS39335.1 hypothetical protein SAMN04488006_1014 [Lutibacter maritimus]